MVFPLYDDNSDRTIAPIVNYALIGVNVFVFVVLQGLGTNDEFTYEFSTVPEKIWTGKDFERPAEVAADPLTGAQFERPAIPRTPIPVYLTLITSMFLHGGWSHILFNMWFLWIFGDNIENYLGHVRYLAFYLVCGVIAGLAHVMATFAWGGDPYIPCLGASGAISAVMGAYILLYPTRRVMAIVFRFLMEVPAYVAVGVWFVLQLISGIGVFGSGAQSGGGVAYGAHIGGFLSGAVLIKLFGFGMPAGGSQQPDVRRWNQEQGY
jgi:membrane associated rhomboid family serine protease